MVVVAVAERLPDWSTEEWDLDCATVRDLEAWFKEEDLITLPSEEIKRELWCKEADKPWCAKQKRLGRCVGTGPRHPKQPNGHNAVWLHNYLTEHGPTARRQVIAAAAAQGICADSVRKAAHQLAIDFGEKRSFNAVWQLPE